MFGAPGEGKIQEPRIVDRVLRYVVLHHMGVEAAHFDLMVETSAGSKLATWRLPNWPPRDGDLFVGLGDHRREYLEYEGEISGNRGRVKRVARGTVGSIQFLGEEVVVVVLGDGIRIVLPKR
jgi:hypothetical protein